MCSECSVIVNKSAVSLPRANFNQAPALQWRSQQDLTSTTLKDNNGKSR